ncbi:MAG: diacylglycerol kinase [Candidatus Altiarchaeales archaeon HGW-Altiarchaeales-2]|nr:MAG: diacylglycerol kinase [Candidatus Altiarchaeales archaeon HGW-Altiarchaeales-2]
MKKNKFIKSVGVAVNGIAQGVCGERNIKIQIIIGAIVILISMLLGLPKTEFIIILIISFLVIILELINTAVEKLIDKLSPGFDSDYGKIKDIMAGAVLLAVVLSIIIGFLILFDHIVSIIFK